MRDAGTFDSQHRTLLSTQILTPSLEAQVKYDSLMSIACTFNIILSEPESLKTKLKERSLSLSLSHACIYVSMHVI